VLARPRAGVTHDELKAGLGVFWTQRITESLSPNLPADQRARALASSIDLRPAATGTSDLRTEFRQPLLVTMALVTLVLLIACVNVANLLLARATVRQREMAMRLAIGASRGRLLRQLLTESLLLTAAGAGLGVLLGSAGSHILLGLMSGISSGPDSSGGIVLDLAFNWRMFTYTVLLAGATTMLFGTLPALRASRLEPALAMTASSTRIAEPRRWIAGVLVTAQVAVSLLLLVGAGLFTRTLQNLRSLDLGFKHDDLLVAEIDATRAVLSRLGPDGRVSKAEALRAFNQEVFDFTRRLPGVRAATTSAVTPLQGGGISQAITVNDQPVAEEVYFNFVSQDFFAVLHTPVAMGREFTAADVATDSPRVAIVNETFVRRYLPPGNPLDQRVTHGKSETLQIVGVVKDAVYDSLRDAVPPTMYVPFTQRESGMSIIVSAPGALAAVATAIRSELQPKLAGRPVRLRTLTTQFESNLVRERMMASVAGAFGVLALVLAAVGLYGLLAYWVTRRTHEIGIRLALGAGPLRVRQHVLGDAVRMLASGTIIGIPLAWAFAHSLSSLLFGLTPADTGTFAGAVAVLTITGLLAAWIPARRASAVNPIAALRVE
jgi:predicted permease